MDSVSRSSEVVDLTQEQKKTLDSPRRKYSLLAKGLFLFMTVFYGKEKTTPKFKVLEVIAPVPYRVWEHAAYIAMTHTYGIPNFAKRGFEFVKENPQFEKESFDSDFKKDYGDFKSLADLFRRIGLDERHHKEESLSRMAKARFS